MRKGAWATTPAPRTILAASLVLGMSAIAMYMASSYGGIVSRWPVPALAPFIYPFSSAGTLEEAPSATQSTSPYWFLDSGGMLVIGGGIGQTAHGALPEGTRWRRAYARSNPTDTDAGAHPQNLFRLLTRSSWGSATTSVGFRIDADNLSQSENRNASNGLLLMSRYQDADTLYYAGVRVDGTAVIKKKYHGVYYTLAQAPLFAGTYGRLASPNLLPHGSWLTLALNTLNLPDGSVRLTLSFATGTNTPRAVLSARDDGSVGGTPAITAPGAVGIRTDFMDVSMKDFYIVGIEAF